MSNDDSSLEISVDHQEETNEDVVQSSSVVDSPHFPLSKTAFGPDDFIRLKFLGKGAVGRVYLVRLRGTDRLYAMKVLTKKDILEGSRVTRVMTEREILASVHHPFVVSLFATFQTRSKLCLVMEFCEGGEFFKLMKSRPGRFLREPTAKFYAAEVLLALEYLHHLGFVYRDLKPENIMIRANGHIALSDFDLSAKATALEPRVVEHAHGRGFHWGLGRQTSISKLSNLDIVDSEPVLQHRNSFVGTLEYIAPEIIAGLDQTAGVDWWTFGILIYEMLVGRTPFVGQSREKTLEKIGKDGVEFPHDSSVSPEARNLVRKLLCRDPSRRLGHLNGASDIKAHKWFKDIKFDLILNEEAPLKPWFKVDPRDLSQYEVVLEVWTTQCPGESSLSFREAVVLNQSILFATGTTTEGKTRRKSRYRGGPCFSRRRLPQLQYLPGIGGITATG